MWGRLLRAFSAAPAPPSAPAPQEEARVHGGLKDEDRIFTNLYCQGDPFIKVLAAAALPADLTFWCHLRQLCYSSASPCVFSSATLSFRY